MSIYGNLISADAIGELLLDVDSGEGHVRISGALFDHDPMLRLDVIGDWIKALTIIRDEAHAELYPESARVGLVKVTVEDAE